MSEIEITPELLEETKQQVKRGRHQFPSYVVLTLIEEVEQLRAAQCWVIVDEAGNTVNGPWFTEAEAIEDLGIYEHEPGHFDKFTTYRVERWKGDPK